MRRRALLGPVLLFAGCAIWAGVAAASPTVVQVGPLKVSIEGGLTPSRLPAKSFAPVALDVDGSLSASDGSQPPALKEVILDSDRNAIINARGLPACRPGQLEARTTAQAGAACHAALVGHGTGAVRVAFPESEPFTAEGPLLIFNGGERGGVTTIFFHVYVAVPAPTAVVVVLRAHREDKGRFGIHSVTKIPVIAGGSGAVTKFAFQLQRSFFAGGRKRGFLEARCVGGHFAALATFEFREEPPLEGLFFSRPCRARE